MKFSSCSVQFTVLAHVDSYLHYRPLLLLQVLQADIDTHEPSVKSVNRSGATLSDPGVAAAVHRKLRDLNARYDAVAERCRERGDDIKSVTRKLRDFNESAGALQQWLVSTLYPVLSCCL